MSDITSGFFHVGERIQPITQDTVVWDVGQLPKSDEQKHSTYLT
jgi:hypothetical protein